MNRILSTLLMAAATFGGSALSAEDFQSLMKVTQTTWPEKKHIGVICDYKKSKDQVWALAEAAGAGTRITVIDTKLPHQVHTATALLARQKADFAVLMPDDRFFYDGSFGATLAMSQLALRGMPTIGTKPSALEQGAVFSVGEGTNGQLLVTNRLIGTVDVILPDRATLAQRASMAPPKEGVATISVSTAE